LSALVVLVVDAKLKLVQALLACCDAIFIPLNKSSTASVLVVVVGIVVVVAVVLGLEVALDVLLLALST